MTLLTLIRGPSGTGKSTRAKRLVNLDETCFTIHLEADMFFCRSGEYRFDPKLLKSAHEWCLNTTQVLLQNNYDVVVSNTFTQLWEMQPYLDYANEHGVQVMVIRMSEQFGNAHGVPEAVVQKQTNRMEDYMGEIYG